MPEPLSFQRIHLARPIAAEQVADLFTRLTSGDVARPLVFEVAAHADGVTAHVGTAPSAEPRLNRLLLAHAPGSQFERATRPHVASVSRVTARPGGLPLASLSPETVIQALYQAFAARNGQEVVGVQLVIGRARRPQQYSTRTADPFQSLGSRIFEGHRDAPASLKRRFDEHAGEARLDVTLRIGVTADTPKRQKALTWEVFGALEQLESPGVRFSLGRDTPARWDSGRHAPGPGMLVSTRDLVPLLAWPLGEDEYPGVQALHPRLLPVPEIVSRTESVFAVGTAPGPERPIGIDPQSRLQHMVVIGPTGSGKSTLLEHLILSDITAGRACCVIEPKAQLIDRILATSPLEAADRIVILDATDEDAPVGFNPLDVGDRDPDIVVDGILAVLAAVFKNGWGPRTEYLIQGALLSLARAGQVRSEPYTLIDLPRLLTDTAFRRPVIAAVADDPTLAAFWAEYEDMRPAQRAAMIASPLNKLRKIVMRKPLVRVLGQSQPRFRLRDIFRERKTLLVPLNEALLGAGAAQLLGSLIVAELFLATTERAAERSPMSRPGMIFIDEVQNYLHLPTPVGDAMSVFRSYGVGLHVAHQFREQLPATMRSGFDANARSKVAFALEADDARDMARLAPALTSSDFEALPRHHIYTRLIAGGGPTAWCSAKALPPAPILGHGNQIRAMSRSLYGSLQPVEITPAVPEPEAPEVAETLTETSTQPTSVAAETTATATSAPAAAPVASPARRAHQKARRT